MLKHSLIFGGLFACLTLLLANGCGSSASPPAPPAATDGGIDAGTPDTSTGPVDAGPPDVDAGSDAGAIVDATPDAPDADVPCGTKVCAPGQLCCMNKLGGGTSCLSGKFCPADDNP